MDKLIEMLNENYEFIPLHITANLTFTSLGWALEEQLKRFSQGAGLVLAIGVGDYKRALEILSLLPPGSLSLSVLPCLTLGSWALIGNKGVVYSPGV